MAVFASKVKIDGKPLTEYLGTDKLPVERFEEIKKNVIQGGATIIKLRGRSSFQSPAVNAVEMIAAAMGGEKYLWPAGTYVNEGKYHNVMMAMPTTIDGTGVHFEKITGTDEELASLDKSYEHLCTMRDELVTLGIMPPVADWKKANPNL
jgi:malate dehydrogenase